MFSQTIKVICIAKDGGIIDRKEANDAADKLLTPMEKSPACIKQANIIRAQRDEIEHLQRALAKEKEVNENLNELFKLYDLVTD